MRSEAPLTSRHLILLNGAIRLKTITYEFSADSVVLLSSAITLLFNFISLVTRIRRTDPKMAVRTYYLDFDEHFPDDARR